MDWEILVASLISFVLGIISAVLVKWLEIRYHRPVIRIEDKVTCKEIELDGAPFIANRIRIRNVGRSGAKSCKVYVESAEDEIERTGWMLSDNDTSYTLTLNVDIPEYVDLCAISNDARTRVITLERGYKERSVKSCTTLPAGDYEITLRVTSSNARPAPGRIKIHDTFTHFPKEIVRIVEFVS